MKKILFVHILFSLILSSLLYAQTTYKQKENSSKNDKAKKLLVITPVNSKFLSPEDKSYINRLAVNISARQKKYHLYISGLKKNIRLNKSLYELEWLVGKNKDLLSIEGRIIDKQKDLIFKRVKKRSIKPSKVKKTAEEILLLLFDLHSKKKKKTKKTTRKKRKKIELPFDKKVSRENLDFKNRILNLKSGINKKILEVGANKKNSQASSDDDSSKKKKKSDSNKNSLLKILKLDDVYQKRKKSKDSGRYTFLNWYSLGLATSNYLIKDRVGDPEEILFRTQLQFYTFHIHSELWHSSIESWGLFSRLGIQSALNSNDLNPPPSFDIDFGVLHSSFNENLYLRLGVRRDTQTFGNLPVLGEGVEAAIVDVTWALASAHLFLFKRFFYTKFEYSSQILSEFEKGNFTDGSLQIQKMKILLGINSDFIYKGTYLELSYRPTYFKAQGSRDIEGQDTSIFASFHFTF